MFSAPVAVVSLRCRDRQADCRLVKHYFGGQIRYEEIHTTADLSCWVTRYSLWVRGLTVVSCLFLYFRGQWIGSPCGKATGGSDYDHQVSERQQLNATRWPSDLFIRAPLLRLGGWNSAALDENWHSCEAHVKASGQRKQFRYTFTVQFQGIYAYSSGDERWLYVDQ